MNYDALKDQLKQLRGLIVNDDTLTDRELDDLKASILVLIMHIEHRKADGR